MKTREEVHSFVEPKVIPGYWTYGGNGHMVVWRIARVYINERWDIFNTTSFKNYMKEIAVNYSSGRDGFCEDERDDWDSLFTFLNS